MLLAIEYDESKFIYGFISWKWSIKAVRIYQKEGRENFLTFLFPDRQGVDDLIILKFYFVPNLMPQFLSQLVIALSEI